MRVDVRVPSPRMHTFDDGPRRGVRMVWFCTLALAAPAARAEDGYDLWLRYRPIAERVAAR